MIQPAAITAALLDKILGLLAPLFLAAAGNDLTTARQAAHAMLASYNARTDDELRLYALSIAFGYGALDALSQAVDPDLSLTKVMRLRNSAVALSRASHQNRAALDKLRAAPPAEPDTHATDVPLPASIEPEALIAFTRAAAKPQSPIQAPKDAPIQATSPLSRQQRRAAERQAAKAQRRHENESRRIVLLAARTPQHHAPQ